MGKTLNRHNHPVFQGKIVTVSVESAQLPDGRHCEIEVVRHPGGAAVVALDSSERVCLIRQYRPAMQQWMWEIPAGKLDPGESPFSTAQRELEEEAGLVASRWRELGSMVSSPGVFTEVVHLFFARDLEHVARQTEEHEVIEVHWLSLHEAVARATEGEIRDAKTVIGLFRAQMLV
jgi:8-oxo-dGTP pyrophosphatase MutT (NUDIX family)